MTNGYNLDYFEAELHRYLSAGNKSRDDSTLKYYLSDIRIFIDWLQYVQKDSSVQIDSVNTLLEHFFSQQSAVEYKRYLIECKTPRSTINRKLSSLRHLHAFCCAEGLIKERSTFSIKNIYKKIGREINTKIDLFKSTRQSKVEQKNVGIKTPDLLAKSTADRQYSLKGFNPLPLLYGRKIRNASATLGIPYLLVAVTLLLVIFALTIQERGTNIKQAHAQNSRTLAFRGTLTDKLGNKIPFKTDVRFRLYATEKSEKALYDSGNCPIIPDNNGQFKTLIGSNTCGERIAASIFDQNQALYLGIKVGKDKEISQRQRIPNSSLAQNTNYLQGFPLGTNQSSVPYISESGVIQLTQISPTLRSSAEDGTFSLQSEADISLESGKSSDVHIITGENGSVHFRNKNNGLDNILISNEGNVSIGTGIPGLFKLEVGGSLGPSLDSIYDLGSSAKNWNNLYVNKICFSTVLDCIEEGFVERWGITNGAISPLDKTNDFLLGATATSSAQIKLSATAGNPSFIRSGYLGIGTVDPISALHVEGTLTLTGNTTDIITSDNENLTISAHNSGIIILDDLVKLGSNSNGIFIDSNGAISDIDGDTLVHDVLSVTGNFNSGTTSSSATTTLDIGGTGTANALCHASADGTDNEGIVDCTSSPTADFAEMYPVEKSATYGDVVSMGSDIVTTKDGQTIRKLIKNLDQYNTKILGVVSNNYGDFISVGHNIDSKDNPMPIALKGRVPVKIDPTSYPIRAGDFLTGSSNAGYAMKADRPGIMIGQALEDWSPGDLKKTAMIFVQTSYADPTPLSNRVLSNLSSGFNSITGNIFIEKEITSPIVRTDRLEAIRISSEYIHSPVVETKTIKTEVIEAAIDKDISIELDNSSKESSRSGSLAKLIIKGLQDRPVTTIDADGNINTTGGITALEASISGTLAAKEVRAENITELQNRLEQAVKKTEGIDRIDNDLNDIQTTLSQIQNQPLVPAPKPLTAIPNILTTDNAGTEGFFSNLVVNGNANLFQISVFNGIKSLSDELKLSAASSINLLDGAAILTKDGNLVLNGTLIAKSGIKTNDIRPLNTTSDIQAHLSTAGEKNSSFTFQNEHGDTVAKIDASGSATFKSLQLDNINIASPSAIIAAADNYLENGQYTPAINTQKAVAGSAMLPPETEEIIIYNEAVKENSLIYLTPTNTFATSPISVAEKQICSATTLAQKPCKPYFKVATQLKNENQLGFNWLIIN